MLRISCRSALWQFVKLNKRQYCRDTFDFLSKPVSVNTNRPKLSPDKEFNKNLILHLEGSSLVDFGDERGIKILEDAISYADQLEEVNTDGIEPLFTVLENESLYLREDAVEKDVNRNELLSHSEKVCEEYYITPVGNIAYGPDDLKSKSSISESKNEIVEQIKQSQI